MLFFFLMRISNALLNKIVSFKRLDLSQQYYFER
jgi:hypothetical protein